MKTEINILLTYPYKGIKSIKVRRGFLIDFFFVGAFYFIVMKRTFKIGKLTVKIDRITNIGIRLEFIRDIDGFDINLSDDAFSGLVKRLTVLSKIFEAEKEFETDEEI